MYFKRKILITISLTIALMVAIGFSYAIFMAVPVKGNNNYNTLTGNTISASSITPTFQITYDEGDQIVDTGLIFAASKNLVKFKVTTNYENSQYIIMNLSTIINSVGSYGSFELYNCTQANYDSATTTNVSTNCTIISSTTNKTLPATGNSKYILNDTYISIAGESTNYFVFLLSTTTTDVYKQYRGVLEVNSYSLTTDLLTTKVLEAHPPVADNIASTYVSASAGINFNSYNTPTNGQGLYTNVKNSQDGTVKYFRGGSYCWLNNNILYNNSSCTGAGGTWVEYDSYHCSLDDSRGDCEGAGGTYYELRNNIMFGGYAWKIIRINNDGSFRVIYNGTSPYDRGSSTGTAYVDYTTGTDDTGSGPKNGGSSEFSKAFSKLSFSNSPIKTSIDTWYTANLSSYSNYIVDAIYCNDMSYTQTTDYNYNFGAYTRTYYPNYTPTFNCPNTYNSIYTVANGKLSVPAALITRDEVLYSGIYYLGGTYTNGYLYNGVPYWTMSPARWEANGQLSAFIVTNKYYDYTNTMDLIPLPTVYTRPVINLKSDVTVGQGTGTLNDPWVITTISN